MQNNSYHKFVYNPTKLGLPVADIRTTLWHATEGEVRRH